MDFKEQRKKSEEKRSFIQSQISAFKTRHKDSELGLISEVQDVLDRTKCDVGHHYTDSDGNINFENVCVSVIKSIQHRAKCKDIVTDDNSELIREKTFGAKQGDLVKIRPCGEEYKDKTYLGFFLGDMAKGYSGKFEQEKLVIKHSFYNPAIFIPEVGKIVYGMESWWEKITSEKELKEISDDDINNVWYVKILKIMNEKKTD